MGIIKQSKKCPSILWKNTNIVCICEKKSFFVLWKTKATILSHSVPVKHLPTAPSQWVPVHVRCQDWSEVLQAILAVLPLRSNSASWGTSGFPHPNTNQT